MTQALFVGLTSANNVLDWLDSLYWIYYIALFFKLLPHYAIMILEQDLYLRLPPCVTEFSFLWLSALSFNHYATLFIFYFWTIFKLNSSSQPQLA